jgi:membrane-bound lytic murein transglycosylase B
MSSLTLIASLALSTTTATTETMTNAAVSTPAAQKTATSTTPKSGAPATSKKKAPPPRPTRLWIWFDDDGTPVVSDRRDSPDAEPYRIGTFEEIMLRQQGAPHAGFSDVVAPSVPPSVLALADSAARKYAVDKALVLAVIGVESGYRSGLVSRAGARGLMQLMPDTAADLQVDPDVDAENVDGGTRFLAGLLRYFDDERLAVAAYNAGPGRVKRAGNTVPQIPETIAYVDAVLALRDAFVERGW